MVAMMSMIEELSSIFWSFFQKEVLFSSILFLLVLGLTRIFKGKSLYLHYGLWALVLFRLVLPPDFSLSFSARSILDKFGLIQENRVKVQPAATNEASFQQGASATLESNANHGKTSQPEAVNGRSNRSLPVSWQSISFLLWICGLLVFATIFLRRYLHYWHVVRKSTHIIDAKVTDVLKNWQGRFDIRREIKIVSSVDCLSPFTIGIFRPAIYLPDNLLSDSNLETLESVVAHELAHIKNYDDFWIKLQNVIQILYFFHPVAWFANSKLNQVRERICDELVLSHGTITPRVYGRSMLAVLKMNLLGPEGVEMLPSFGNHKKKFSSRIQDILKIRRIRKSNVMAVSLLVLGLAVLLLPMAQGSNLSDSRGETIKLKRMVNGAQGFQIRTAGAGSRFMKIASGAEGIFCESKLPEHLDEMEFAAIGIFDSNYRKIWVLKGVNSEGGLEIYVDTNGDNCFTDERPLQTKKKTAKYHYEGSDEWSMTKYIKAPVLIDYESRDGSAGSTKKFAVYLVYYPQDNFLEFSNNEFWYGKANFGDRSYAIAVYGGLKDGWYLRPTFEKISIGTTQNEFRIDLNQDRLFANMTFFDPTDNSVIQEKYFINEPLKVNGMEFKISSLEGVKDAMLLVLAPGQQEHKMSKLSK